MSTPMKVAVIALIVCYCSNANIIQNLHQEEGTKPPPSKGIEPQHPTAMNTSTPQATMPAKDQQPEKKVVENATEEDIPSGGENVHRMSSGGADTTHRPLRVLKSEDDVDLKRGATDGLSGARRGRSKDRPEQKKKRRRYKSLRPQPYLRERWVRPKFINQPPEDTTNGPDPSPPSNVEPEGVDTNKEATDSPPVTFENSHKTGAVYNVFLHVDLGKDNKKTREVLKHVLEALGEDDSETSPPPPRERTSEPPPPQVPSQRPPPQWTRLEQTPSIHPDMKATSPAHFTNDEVEPEYEDETPPFHRDLHVTAAPTASLPMSQQEKLIITHPCSTDHKRYIRKREEAGCIGAIAFSNIVCRDFLDCMLTKDGPIGKCSSKICKKFKAMPKNEKCLKELFDC